MFNYVSWYYEHLADPLFNASLILFNALVTLHLVSFLYYYSIANDTYCDIVKLDNDFPTQTREAYTALFITFYKNWTGASRIIVLTTFYSPIIITVILLPWVLTIGTLAVTIAYFIMRHRARRLRAKEAISAITNE